MAYELWPDNPACLWHGFSVFAIDGSKYNLPATKEIREKYDPDSGLGMPGKGHYPTCLVSTLYDVFRRLPIARTVVGIKEADERKEAKKLLPCLPNPSKSVCLFDQGYPSFDIIFYLLNSFLGYFVFRCPISSSFPAIATFIKSGRKEAKIWITPSNSFLSKLAAKDRKDCCAIKIRIVKLRHPDGTISVLLTNLYKTNLFPRKEIIDLYFKRWSIETHYRDEKVVLEIEKFHTKKINGILQELYAVMIMSVISRILMTMASEQFCSDNQELQFKNAVLALAADATILAPDNPVIAAEIFNAILLEIARVKYYRPKKRRPPQPRFTKRAINKWQTQTKRHA